MKRKIFPEIDSILVEFYNKLQNQSPSVNVTRDDLFPISSLSKIFDLMIHQLSDNDICHAVTQENVTETSQVLPSKTNETAENCEQSVKCDKNQSNNQGASCTEQSDEESYSEFSFLSEDDLAQT